MSSRTIRIVHRPPTVWELNQEAEGHRLCRVAAYREVARVIVRSRRVNPAIGASALNDASIASEAGLTV